MTDEAELVRLIGTRFVERKDAKSFQGSDGGWYLQKDRQDKLLPMTLTDFRNHLAGGQPMGHYLVGQNGKVKLFAYDLDLNKEGRYHLDHHQPGEGEYCEPRKAWQDTNHPAQWWLRLELRCMAEALALSVYERVGVPVAVLDSGGKGLHVYAFLGSTPAAEARELGNMVLRDLGSFELIRGNNFWRQKHGDYDNLTIEVFPKQDGVAADGFGNLMALPLGVNRKTGKQRRFIRLRNGYDQPWEEMPPEDALTGTLPWED